MVNVIARLQNYFLYSAVSIYSVLALSNCIVEFRLDCTMLAYSWKIVFSHSAQGKQALQKEAMAHFWSRGASFQIVTLDIHTGCFLPTPPPRPKYTVHDVAVPHDHAECMPQFEAHS